MRAPSDTCIPLTLVQEQIIIKNPLVQNAIDAGLGDEVCDTNECGTDEFPGCCRLGIASNPNAMICDITNEFEDADVSSSILWESSNLIVAFVFVYMCGMPFQQPHPHAHFLSFRLDSAFATRTATHTQAPQSWSRKWTRRRVKSTTRTVTFMIQKKCGPTKFYLKCILTSISVAMMVPNVK